MRNGKFIPVLMLVFDLVLVRRSAIAKCAKGSGTLDPKPTSRTDRERVKFTAPKIRYDYQATDKFRMRPPDGRRDQRYFTDFYDYENEYSTDSAQKIVAHSTKTTTESSFDFFGDDESDNGEYEEYHDDEYDDDEEEEEEDDYSKYDEEDREETDYGGVENVNPNADITSEDKKKQIILRRLRRRHEVHELIFPLLMAYKLKFFIMLPLLVGALVLLIGTTGVAGFFFALFSAALGLRGKTH